MYYYYYYYYYYYCRSQWPRGLRRRSTAARLPRSWVRILQHRVVDCGERQVIWHWTRARIAAILRKDPLWIPVEWVLRPDFQLWPPQRQAAVIWILAHLIAYSLQSTKRLSLLDYVDFLRRARWRLYNGP